MIEKYLIIGLGNPGRAYSKTRHNVGYWVVDELARRHQLPQFTSERKAKTSDGLIRTKRVVLAKPQTYMNLSGEAVRALLDFYKIKLEQIIVVHDDLDLPLGTLRLRTSGGHGGQNGVRNIIKHLGTQEFARLRFGIGRPPGKMQARNYVLQPFHGDDAILAQQVVEKAADAIEIWLQKGIEKAMSQYNGDINDNQESQPNLKEQIQLSERAHELKPDDPKPLQKLTKLYKHAGQHDDSVRAHLQLAEIYHEKNKTQQMIHHWEQAVAIRPQLTQLREEIAGSYEAQGNHKKAVLTWLKLAEYQAKEGAMSAALAAVDEALRINPKHPKALDLQLAYKDKLTL